MDLTNRQEKTLFKVNAIIASLLWIAIILGTFGIALFYILIAYIFFLFTQSALISQLKGNGAQVSAEQFPDLYEKIQAACTKLKMQMPEAYLMNGNGLLNAFATKFLRRHYIVLYSDIVDSLEDRSASIDFYIGHELGHLQRQHLRWWPLFLPLYIFPLLMPAYRRACELTCDQYGKFCSSSTDDAVKALSVLVAGQKRWKSMSSTIFTSQTRQTGGFWMSFHEITGTYPWLSKRIAVVQDGESFHKFPKRSWSAWVVGFFCPGFLSGAFFPLIAFYVIFILSVIALPAFKNFRNKSLGHIPTPEVRNVGINQWTHPVSRVVLDLPRGFETLSLRNEPEIVVGLFSSNPDLNVERLVLEKAAEKIAFPEYVQMLRNAKLKMLGATMKLSQPQMRKVNDIDVAEFGFFDNSGGTNFENVIRVWTKDNLTFWHVISTIRSDSKPTYGDSERMLEFLTGL